MDEAKILRRFDAELRRAPVQADPAYRGEQLPDVTRIVGPGPGAHDNYVEWSRLDGASADPVCGTSMRRSHASPPHPSTLDGLAG